jgi:protein arginine kinase activator
MVQVVNGKRTEQHLCSHCAGQQEGGWQEYSTNMNKLLSNFFEPAISTLVQQCKSCGTTFDEFKRSGLFGCPECYSAFQNSIAEPIRRIQGGATRHIGKKPEGEAKPEAKKEPTLKEQLQQAIAEENYELAAELRDRIREQEGK